jgi:hypothetical protein
LPAPNHDWAEERRSPPVDFAGRWDIAATFTAPIAGRKASRRLTAGMREPYPTDLERRQFSRSDKMTATPDGDRRLARRLEESRVRGRQALACRPRCAEGRRVRHQYPVNGRHRVQGGIPVGASPLRRKGLRTPRSGRAGCSACSVDATLS